MCFLVTGYNKFNYTLKCCQLIQQRQLAVECTVFRNSSAAEFHKLRRGIWQNLPRKNVGARRLATTVQHGTERINELSVC